MIVQLLDKFGNVFWINYAELMEVTKIECLQSSVPIVGEKFVKKRLFRGGW